MASFKAQAVAVKSASSGYGREGKVERKARIARFFADPLNRVLVAVGKLLAYPINEKGETAASILAAGGTVPVDAFEIDGIAVDIEKGFTLAISTIGKWGCMVCGSCEGSGVHPSPSRDELRLLGSQWYYNPATCRLVTISSTCYLNWIAADHKARIVSSEAYGKFLRLPKKDDKAKGGEKVA